MNNNYSKTGMLELNRISMNGTEFDYEFFFELTPDLLCIAGFDGYFKKINPAVSKLLGYTMEELYARPINDFVHKEDQTVTARTRSELTKGKPLLNFENRYVTKNGEIVWLSWTSFPVEQDQVVFAIAKDITHKKKLEEERNVLLANLTKVNYDLKQLTYTTSHDLRSPVNNLLAIFNMMDITRINDEETLELIDILKSAAEGLKDKLNNYIDTVVERNSAKVHVEEVSLRECLNTVLLSVHSLIENSQATIHADFSKLSRIKFNRAYMESVFLNLITNSIKYAQPDQLPVITIYTENINNTDRLIFMDNGLGFNLEKVKDKVFGLNQKFHDHSDSKGIGLYLVHSHVTGLGGKISVESKPNEGTRFIISFRNDRP